MRTLPFLTARLAGLVVTSAVALASGGSDECAQAPISDAITGSGIFAVDTTGAHQRTPWIPCMSEPGGDVWFYWTSTFAGTATISTCNSVTADSVIAVWRDGTPAGSCPTSFVTCSDDDCGTLQSRVTFAVSPGEKFFLELAHWGSGGYVGTFLIEQHGTVGNDACATPMAISGTGTFPFSNQGSSTGPQGQSESLCSFAGGTAITFDVWYAWTAPSSGAVSVSSCGGTSLDTKIAVYAGTGCPSSPAIACGDDSCGRQTRLQFDAIAGQAYTIQIGCGSFTGLGTGSFTLDYGAPPVACRYDDGSADYSMGASRELLTLQLFAADVPTAVGSISAAFGPSWDTSLDGLPFRAAIWEDPNDDGLPYTDLVLLATATGVISQTGAGSVWVQVDFAAPVVVTGAYFVGCSVVHGPQQSPGALDSSQSSSGRAYFAATGGSIDLEHPASAPNGVRSLDVFGLGGYVWLLRTDCAPTGTLVCGGFAASCPCGNGGAPGQGCANSFQPAGARLVADGDSSVLFDSVVLTASGMPSGAQPGTCTFAQSSSLAAGVAFGDGVSCLGGSVMRLGTRSTTNGTASFGAGIPGDPSVGAAGHVVAPGSRVYQVVYRNPAPFCTSATFNVTNGFEIAWY